jgi:hypothetical protein
MPDSSGAIQTLLEAYIINALKRRAEQAETVEMPKLSNPAADRPISPKFLPIYSAINPTGEYGGEF